MCFGFTPLCKVCSQRSRNPHSKRLLRHSPNVNEMYWWLCSRFIYRWYQIHPHIMTMYICGWQSTSRKITTKKHEHKFVRITCSVVLVQILPHVSTSGHDFYSLERNPTDFLYSWQANINDNQIHHSFSLRNDAFFFILCSREFADQEREKRKIDQNGENENFVWRKLCWIACAGI